MSAHTAAVNLTRQIRTHAVEFHGVSRSFRHRDGRLVPAIVDVDLTVDDGQRVMLVGPSGCGKTTLLNLAAGLDLPTTGTVHLEGQEVKQPTGRAGYMFARDALFPWRTIERNVTFALEAAKASPSRRVQSERARELLALVGLTGYEHAYRSELSHGMRQRAALARTLAPEPAVMLMDEPFGALDAQTKAGLQDVFTALCKRLNPTVLFVTHDLREALKLGNRVVVISGRPGRVVLDVQLDQYFGTDPADNDGIEFTSEFHDLYHQLHEALGHGDH